MNKYILFICLNLGLYTQSLNTFVEQLSTDNLILKSYEHKINAISHRAEMVSGLPDLKIKSSYYPSEIRTAYGEQVAVLNIEQSFPWFGTLGTKKEIVEIDEKRFLELKKGLKLSLIHRLKTTYSKIASIQLKQSLYKEYVELLTQFRQSAITRYENGQSKQSDMLNVQTELISIQNKISQLDSKYRQQIATINHLCNSDYERIDASFYSVDSILKDVNLSSHVELESLNYLSKSFVKKQELSQKKAMPKISVGLNYHLINEPNGMTENKDAYGVSLGLTLPFLSSKYTNEHDVFESEQHAVDFLKLSKAKQIEEQLSVYKFDLTRISEQLKRYKTEMIPTAEILLKSTITAYETGSKGILSLLESQRILLKFKVEQIELNSEYLNVYSAYQKEMGDSYDSL